jgi:hypothetical protein
LNYKKQKIRVEKVKLIRLTKLPTAEQISRKIRSLAKALPKQEQAGLVDDFSSGKFKTVEFTLEYALSDFSGIEIKDLRLMVLMAWMAYLSDSFFMAGFISESLARRNVAGAKDCLRAAIHRGYTTLLDDVSSKRARSENFKVRKRQLGKSLKGNPFAKVPKIPWPKKSDRKRVRLPV